MHSQLQPTISRAAATRWVRAVPSRSPWLHEEVARRMEERLSWLTLRPRRWLHWEPLRGGLGAQALLEKRYPQAKCYAVHATDAQTQIAKAAFLPEWWQVSRWLGQSIEFSLPRDPVQMLWANMSLHMLEDPQAVLKQWHQLLEPDGFLMFSCLGPDTLRELRQLYQEECWPPATHSFTDMHDWGDMLLEAGFSDPVMDTERITLTFATPERLLSELRELGRNLHPQRFSALRGRRWYQSLLAGLRRTMGEEGDGKNNFRLTFEVVYGHAIRGQHRVPMGAQSSISLQAMRDALGIKKERLRSK